MKNIQCIIINTFGVKRMYMFITSCTVVLQYPECSGILNIFPETIKKKCLFILFLRNRKPCKWNSVFHK